MMVAITIAALRRWPAKRKVVEDSLSILVAVFIRFD
jgi:hypothetical protein